MQITVVCPRCETLLHLDESTRGKRVRCPNSQCRTIFEARAESDKAPPPPPEPPPPKPENPVSVVSGSVADFVQLLPAQLAEPAPPPPIAKRPPEPPKPSRPARPKEPPAPKPVEAPMPAPVAAVEAAAIAPPPIRVAPTVAPSGPAPVDFPDDFPGDDGVDGEPKVSEGPQEVGPGVWEAPPVRGVDNAPAGATAVIEPPPVVPAAEPPVAHTARRRAVLGIAGLALVAAIVVGYFLWKFENVRAGSEADRFTLAQERYDRGDYSEAADVLKKLIRDFPASPNIRKYSFMAELSVVRSEADAAQDVNALKPAFMHVQQFLSFNEQEPLLKDRHADVLADAATARETAGGRGRQA